MSLVVKESLIRLRDGRLHLYRQNDSKNWLWRTFLNGKYVVRSTKNENLVLAKSIAEHEYDKLRFQTTTPDGTVAHSWAECERGFLNSLAHDESNRPSRVRNYKVKLGILAQYFHSYLIHTIKTKQIEEYLCWRKDTYKPPYKNYHSETVSNKTLRSDLLALRQVLKYAKREEWIRVLPDFPKLTVKPRPSGWFTSAEMVKLFKFTHQWIWQEGISGEERCRRAYVDCYIKWLVFTGMRVDEALQVRFEDVTIVSDAKPRPCLFVQVKGGKLSYRKGTTEMIGLHGALGAFEELQRIMRPRHPHPHDLLFPVNPRDTIQELLKAAGLLLDERGQRRTAKSFRHTYIMNSLLHNVDAFVLAKNCRTSVDMIQEYYGSYLTARMKQAELTKMFARVKPVGRSK
ncbi:MAG: site-specific integrase [Nitrospira sp.]|nr:site-specific integrase [Nitrospira sp.]